MWSAAQFKKVTGVAPEASTEAMEAALMKKHHATLTNEIAVAMLCYRLTCLQWKGSEAASVVGLSTSTVSRKANQGAVLWACGEDQAETVWLWVKPMTGDPLTKLSSDLDSIQATHDESAEQRRTAFVIQSGRWATVAARLGDNATEDRTQAICAALADAGHTLPVAVAKAIPGIASGMEIPLPPPKKRSAGPNDDAPSATVAAGILDKVVTDRRAGTDEGQPLEFRPDEILAAWNTVRAALRIIVTDPQADKYAVADKLAEMVDAAYQVTAVPQPVA